MMKLPRSAFFECQIVGRLGATAGLIVSILSLSAGDVSAASVSVLFSAVAPPSPVPLSPWAMALLAAILALFARKALGRSAILVLFGASLLMPYKTGLNEAHAYTYTVATTFNLVFPSPTVSPNIAYGQDISVVNATGQTIRIDDVFETHDFINDFRLVPPTLAPACARGMILSPAAVCFVRVR